MKLKLSLMLLFSLAGNSLVFAQWDSYPTFQAYRALMSKFQADYPQFCKTVDLGTSVKGKKLVAVKISDSVDKQEKEPAFLYSATMHGDEALGYMLTLRLISYLLENYGKDPLVTKLVDNMEIWIDPLVNPDGTYNSDENSVAGAIRCNANGIDLNRNWPCWCLLEAHKFGIYNAFEPEVKALKEAIDPRPLVLSADIQSGSLSIIYPSWHIPKVDKPWWHSVCKMYSDTAIKVDPNYILKIMPDDSISGLYEAHGTWLYYPFIYRHCRNISLELSVTKLLSPSQLNQYWNYNYRSMLNYMEQTLFGIQGTVTDSMTGKALQAKVFVENHDIDSSIVYSFLPFGDFYRPIFKGTYSVTFSANGYVPKTITDIQVENNIATVLDVKLVRGMSGISVCKRATPEIKICLRSGSVAFVWDADRQSSARVSLFDASGRLIRELSRNAGDGQPAVIWDGLDNTGKPVPSGCYTIQVRYKDKNSAQRFVLSRR